MLFRSYDCLWLLKSDLSEEPDLSGIAVYGRTGFFDPYLSDAAAPWDY